MLFTGLKTAQVSSLLLAGATFFSGCSEHQRDARLREDISGQSANPLTAQKVHPENQATTNQYYQAQEFNFRSFIKPSALLATNTVQFQQSVRSIKSLEAWLMNTEGDAVLSSKTRRTPQNDRAVADLQYLLNIYNSVVPMLHSGQQSWRPIPVNGVFNDSQRATEALLRRTQKHLGLIGSGKAGRETIFETVDAISQIYGLEPRLHTIMKATVITENATLSGSPNVDPYKKYPNIAGYCAEKTRRIIEPVSSSPNIHRDVAIVTEIQHCLIKLGYNLEIPQLKQTGRRDNATDEALKLFMRDFWGKKGPVVFDQGLIYSVAHVSTGFDLALGATLTREFKGVPYAKDPYKTYCGMTYETFQSWCRNKKIPMVPLLDIKEAHLRACMRDEFVIPSGANHLLVVSHGARRVEGLQLSIALIDEAYNRSASRALKTIAKVLKLEEVKPTLENMYQLLRDPRSTLCAMYYYRGFSIGYNDSALKNGLMNRLDEGTNWIQTVTEKQIKECSLQGYQDGQQERLREERARAQKQKKK